MLLDGAVRDRMAEMREGGGRPTHTTRTTARSRIGWRLGLSSMVPIVTDIACDPTRDPTRPRVGAGGPASGIGGRASAAARASCRYVAEVFRSAV